MRLIPQRLIEFLGELFSASLVERRAEKIQDPVARLRYLQRSRSPFARLSVLRASNSWRNRKLPALGIVVLLICLLIPRYKVSSGEKLPLPPRPVLSLAQASSAEAIPNVWVVDQTRDFETYSNGLRIDDRYSQPNQKRVFYPVYRRGAIDPAQPEWRSEPAGIVYHTTESDQARFTADQNVRLKRIGKAVIDFVQQNHSYHFLIDRFGQVFRIVPESDVANHAGYSVWADDTIVFVNLNSSFLGVAFETRTQHDDQPSANPAQVHAARVLTEMLRAKYHIRQSNCVTHAQVSVNPDNMLMGYHTDWAANFPFVEIGLPDNYAQPPASIYAFGFDYDPTFVRSTGARIWQGLAAAEDQVQMQAAAHGVPVSAYRASLQKKYKEVLATLRASTRAKENIDET